MYLTLQLTLFMFNKIVTKSMTLYFDKILTKLKLNLYENVFVFLFIFHFLKFSLHSKDQLFAERATIT